MSSSTIPTRTKTRRRLPVDNDTSAAYRNEWAFIICNYDDYKKTGVVACVDTEQVNNNNDDNLTTVEDNGKEDKQR